MKKTTAFLLGIVLAFSLLAASAESINDVKNALHDAVTLDEQLTILHQAAEDYADTLESGGWGLKWNVSPGTGWDETLIPENWDECDYTLVHSIPDEMRGRPFIVLKVTEQKETLLFGDFYTRLPADMRASSLEEAEYALIVEYRSVESGYKYSPPATSYTKICRAFILDLRTREAVMFWWERHDAKRSGYANDLDGEPFTDQGVWNSLRSEIMGEISLTMEDGTVLHFGISGTTCFLKSCEGEPVTLDLPAAVDGYTVTEIDKQCFRWNETLTSITLPDGLTTIGENAFRECAALEEVHLPDTLKIIRDYAFFRCKALKRADLPDNVVEIGNNAFDECEKLQYVRLPENLKTIGKEVFWDCNRIAWVIVPESFGSSFNGHIFFFDHNLTCIYLPSTVYASSGLTSLIETAVICAPEGSQALNWAIEKERESIVCEKPEDMPMPEYITEGDFEFLIFRGIAAVSDYHGDTKEVRIPETAAGCPVKSILYKAIYAENDDIPMDIYIQDPELTVAYRGIGRKGSSKAPITVHGPDGCPAADYVAETSGTIDAHIEFTILDSAGD